MRYYSIMVFIFIFNLSLSIVNDLNLFGLNNTALDIAGQSATSYALTNINAANQSIGVVSSTAVNPSSTLSWFNAAFQFIIVLIPTAVKIFLDTTILFPFLLNNIGMPMIIVAPLSTIVYFIEIMALYQWITGRSFKEVE